jgi:glutathione S-transferase
VPVLELDDGTCISESVSICRYLEDLHPEPNLFGRDAKERANVDMWIRRIEFRLMTPVGQVWVHTHPFTQRSRGAHSASSSRTTARRTAKRLCVGCELFDRELAGRSVHRRRPLHDGRHRRAIDFDFAAIGVDIPDDSKHAHLVRSRRRAPQRRLRSARSLARRSAYRTQLTS